MPRKQHDVEPQPIQRPHVVVESNAVFTLVTARAALGTAKNCLPREIRKRRLRVSKRGGRYYILGKWLLEWIEEGEIIRKPERAGQSSSSTNGGEANA
ncbi:MAG: hypothetical protein ACFCD0_27295 [Gemmataceae bacterium]